MQMTSSKMILKQIIMIIIKTVVEVAVVVIISTRNKAVKKALQCSSIILDMMHIMSVM